MLQSNKSLIFIFILWRIALFLPLFVAFAYITYRSGYEFTTIWSKVTPNFPINSFLLYPWANFDGVHYLSIASLGYITEGQFFPLYPLLISIIGGVFDSNPFGIGYFLGGLLLSNICFLGSLILFYKLINIDYASKVASTAVITLLLFPTSFFFVSIYSESLFLFLLLLAFYFARNGRWWLAVVVSMLLTSTRLIGVLILPALLVELMIQEGGIKQFINKLKNWQIWVKIFSLLLIITPLLTYAYYNFYKWNQVFYFIKAHGNLANGRSVSAIVLFPQTMIRYLKILLSLPIVQYEWWIALLEITAFLFVVILLIIAWKKRVRFSYLVFSVLAFLVPVSSGTFSGLPRYVILLFPIYIVLAMINMGRKRYIYFILSSVLLYILLAFFARGFFVA